MSSINLQTPETNDRKGDINLLLRRLDRDNWLNAIVPIVVLLAGIVALSLPKFLPLYMQGFLILIFSIYAMYRNHLFKVLRNELAVQLETVTEQRVRANNLYELAVLDPLTGLYNRRFVEDRLRAEIARAERRREPLMVLLLDLDNFKQVNDRFGHAAGDSVLTELAQRIRKAVRASDFAVRMGGDEFLVLLPECPPENVQVILSRLAPFDMDFGGEKISVSCSIGYAQHQAGEIASELVRRADQALYAAKAAGRVRDTEACQITSL